MAQIQLDFFQELSEIEILKAEIADVRLRGDNMRKGLFARHNELAKLYMELKSEYDTLKHAIKDKKVKADD